MKPKLHEKGQALILIAFGAIVLVGFTGLAIDGSRVFSDRRHAQNAADTAALAAALSKIRADPPATGDAIAEAAGLARAASNGYDNTNSIVEVHNCAESNLNPPCEGLPTGADLAEKEKYLQVVIRLTTYTTFARVLGRTEIPSVVSAIARAEPGGPGPVGGGFALSAMSPDDENAVYG
ncbi:MAG: Tad domain-containing protein, partial [Byssovorax cruenta]